MQSTPSRVKSRTSTGDRIAGADDELEEVTDHEILALLDGLSETMTGIELKYTIVPADTTTVAAAS